MTDLIAVGIEYEIEVRAADKRRGLVAEKTARSVGGIEKDSSARRTRDHVGGVLGHEPIARLALAKSFLGHAALGDVVVHADGAHDIAGRVDNRRTADLQPDARSALAPYSH